MLDLALNWRPEALEEHEEAGQQVVVGIERGQVIQVAALGRHGDGGHLGGGALVGVADGHSAAFQRQVSRRVIHPRLHLDLAAGAGR